MPGADVKGMLKLNAKKIAEVPRAFFFAIDKGQDPVLYIDRKFDDPKRFGNAKKVIKVCQALFEVELSTKTKICAGTVVRDEGGVLLFTPVVQKSNAGALKKGLKAFKKEVGRSQVVATESEDGASSTGVPLSAVEAALKAFHKGRKGEPEVVAKLAEAGIDAIDRYASQVAESNKTTEDEILSKQDIRGRSLAEWRAELVDAQGDDDDFTISETLEELLAEQREVTAELEKSKQQFTEMKQRVEKGEAAVTDSLLSRMLVDIVKIGDIDTDRLKDKMSGSLTKLKEAVSSQDTQREEALDKIVELEVVASKADLKKAMDDLERADLTEEQRQALTDEVAQGKMRLEHAEVKQEIRVLEKRVDELTETVEKLEDEACDEAVSQTLVATVQGGLDAEAIKQALSGISNSLNKAIAELEAAESELQDCRDKERLLNSLRELGRTFTRLQGQAGAVVAALSDPELSDDDRRLQHERMLNVRIEIDQNLAELHQLRAQIREAAATTAPPSSASAPSPT